MSKSLLNQHQRVLGTKNPKPVRIPTSEAIPRMVYGESIIEMKRTRKWVSYFAYGKVIALFKNDDFDLAYVDFGKGGNNCTKIYFHTLSSRKQLNTLKIGQYAMFGLLRNFNDAKNNVSLFLVIWAMGIYVPKMVDIRNSALTEEELEVGEMSNEDYDVGYNFLDQFKKND